LVAKSPQLPLEAFVGAVSETDVDVHEALAEALLNDLDMRLGAGDTVA
jgi:hypothetical protein